MPCARHALVIGLIVLVTLSSSARGGAEVKLDRDFIAGLVEKLPPAPFKKDNQYHGEAKGFRLIGIDPNSRRMHVRCEIVGAYRPVIAQAVHQGQADKNAGGGWKTFAFDVLAAVKAEPGPDGAPRFTVEILEVKPQVRARRPSRPGASLILGRYFDDLVTQVADGKAQALGNKMNAQLRKKIDAFKEYGVLREIGYASDQLTLVFERDQRYKSDGIAGYVFATQKPGTVPLFRWSRPRFGDRYYTTTPGAIPGHPYYVFDGIACYVYPTAAPGTAPRPAGSVVRSNGSTRPGPTSAEWAWPAAATAPRPSPATSSPSPTPPPTPSPSTASPTLARAFTSTPPTPTPSF